MEPKIRRRVSLKNPTHFLALGFGSGLAPKMPGTFGTVAALPLVIVFAMMLDVAAYMAITMIVSVVAIWLCGKTANDMGVHDDSSIVWDEIAGMMIAMIAVPLTWQNLLVAFVLFRIFDILKPWPISLLDKKLHGGLGIMLDDIVAGIATLAIMQFSLGYGWL